MTWDQLSKGFLPKERTSAAYPSIEMSPPERACEDGTLRMVIVS
jgi:hypothetical protein